MPGVVLHPQPCVHCESAHKSSPQVSRNKRHSLRDGLRLMFVLSPVSMTF
jgi:hypothetical protein